jgi:hypothetical protein
MIAIPQKLILPTMIAVFPFASQKRSHSPKMIALSTAKMIAFLNMNQQDNDDRTFSSQSNRTFNSQNDRVFKHESTRRQG